MNSCQNIYHFGNLCHDFHLQEMRKLLQTFKAPEAPPPRRAGRRNDRGVHAKPLRELSVLRWGSQLFRTVSLLLMVGDLKLRRR